MNTNQEKNIALIKHLFLDGFSGGHMDVIDEVFHPEFELDDVNMVRLPSGPVVLATFEGPRALIPFEVKEFQDFIRKRLHKQSICLLARCLTTVDVDERGRILYGWSHFGKQTLVSTRSQR